MPFRTISKLSTSTTLGLLRHWLPEGRKQGFEWISLNPTRNDQAPGSFKVNIKTGRWCEFANPNNSGGDLVSLLMYLNKIDHRQAQRIITRDIQALRDQITAPSNALIDDLPEEHPLSPTASVPSRAFLTHRRFNRTPDHSWLYLNCNEMIVLGVFRWDLAAGKEIRQATPRMIDGKTVWKWTAHPAPRPLYNLTDLLRRGDAPVLVVEGEKSADAAAKLAPSFVVTTWPGGAQAVDKADWSPLKGRTAVVWPDADDPGRAAAEQVAACVHKSGGACRILSLEGLEHRNQMVARRDNSVICKELPSGWDAADAAMAGWQPADLTDILITDTDSKALAPSNASFRMEAGGLFYREGDTWSLASAPFTVLAEARDGSSEGWSWLLSFLDRDGRMHRSLMPKRKGNNDGVEIISMLRDQGLDIEPLRDAQRALIAYLFSTRTGRRARLVDRPGWHDDAYLLSDRAGTMLGNLPDGEVLIAQSPPQRPSESVGDLASWRDAISSLAIGNSRLALCLSSAFAAPLLHLLGSEGGGIHLRGQSSCGKSTALLAAASVSGTHVTSWRTTQNGLEATATAHSDSLLLIDELGEGDPMQVGKDLYMIANGVGKARMTPDIGQRRALTWRVLFLSSGEQNLTEFVRDDGKQAKAGQELRMLDVPADAGAGLGIWENLHGHIDGGAFSRHVKEVSLVHRGIAGPAFLRWLIDHRSDLDARWKAFRSSFHAHHLPSQASGQVERAIGRFALVAFAGELATEAGVTGWPSGEATNGVAACSQAWLRDHAAGSGALEESAALAHVRLQLLRHGAARFERIDHGSPTSGSDPYRVSGRLGWVSCQRNGDIFEYIIPSGTWAEFCGSHNSRLVASVLVQGGHLKQGRDRRPTQVRSIAGLKNTRCYVISASILSDGPANDALLPVKVGPRNRLVFKPKKKG